MESVQVDTQTLGSTSASASESSCCARLAAKVSDQDFTQKLNASITFVLELYRVLMGAMLLMFVPQKCGDNLCSSTELMFADGGATYDANYVVNFVTLGSFLFLYVVEFRREHKMIDYLDVNPKFASDNTSVGNTLMLLPDKPRHTILNLDHNYQRATYLAMFFFFANTIFSGCSIYDKYLDSKTTSVFFTNIIFLAMKLIDANALANTETNIFYSAYLKNRVQYNYVDADKIAENESHVTLVNIPTTDSNA
jgi:hypothetical protein